MKRYLTAVSFVCFIALLFSCEKRVQKTAGATDAVQELIEKGENSSLEPEERLKVLDSAFTLLSGHRNDSLTRYNFRRVAIAYYNMNLYDKSLVTGKKIYNMALTARDTVSMAKGLLYAGESYYGKANNDTGFNYNDSAFAYYNRAERLFVKLNDKVSLGEVVLYKAYIYYNVGEYALCESEAVKALDLLKVENRPTDIYNCYNLIATALDGQNNNDEAIKYFKLALDELDNFGREGYSETAIYLYKASCYNNMGGVYVKKGDHEQAIKIYKEALNLTNLKEVSPSLYAKLINNLATARFDAGHTEGLPELLFESLEVRDSLDNTQGVIASNVSLGEYYAAHRDTAKAVAFLKQAYRDAEAIKSNFDILNSLKLLSGLDQKNNDFYYRRYITLSDSLQEVAKQNRNRFARIEYETDRLLDEKEELVKKNSFIIGVSAVLLLFIAAIFIIYYLNSKNKELLLVQEQQKANEEIYQLMFEQQFKIDNARREEKNRIAMELHDGILNNIYAVRLNLEFINKKADEESIGKRKEYIKELQSIETEIRGVSHDLSRNAIFNHEQDFRNILEFMITSQKNSFETDFEAEIDASIDWEGMSNVCKVNVYRIVQEALQNVNKYSEASNAKVEMHREDGDIRVTVTDNGTGFDPEKAKGGIGLKNLRKRAGQLNGSLDISSAPGKGTKVEVVFPVQ